MADQKVLVNLHGIREAVASDTLLIESTISSPTNLTFTDPNTNGGSPVTLNQLFTTGGVTNWTDLGDTQPSILANQFVKGNATGTGLEFASAVGVTAWTGLSDTENTHVEDAIPHGNSVPDQLIFDPEVRGDNVKTAEPTVSGIFSQTHGELSVVSGTQVGVFSGNAKLTERVNDEHYRYYDTNWPTQNVTIPGGVLSDPYGVVYLEDPTFTGTATIVSNNISVLDSDFLRNRVILGFTVHEGGVLIDIINAPDVWKDNSQAVEDLWDIVGIRKRDGTGVHLEVPGGYTSQVTAARISGRGIGFRTNPADPNHVNVPAVNPLTFDTVASDGTVFGTGLTSFPKTWNNGGTETALTGKKAAVTQVYQLPGRAVAFAQLGTTEHGDFDKAKEKIGEEIINNPLPDVAQQLGFRLSYVIIGNDSTQWVDGNAEIIRTSSSGGGGGGGGSAAETAIPILSFAHTADVTLGASPVSPAWDTVNHVAVDPTYFTYPSAGSISANEVEINRKGLYEINVTTADVISSGSFANPGMGVYVNGVQVATTIGEHALDSCITLNDKTVSTVQLLDVGDLVTPGFFRFTGSCRSLGNTIMFSIKFLKAEA